MTLVVIKGQANEIMVTASELSTSGTDSFRFVFTGDQEQIAQELTLNNISDYRNRYDLFEFTEGTDITFKLIGQYKYQVYDLNDVLVEIGKMEVINADQASSYTFPFPNQDNVIYS